MRPLRGTWLKFLKYLEAIISRQRKRSPRNCPRELPPTIDWLRHPRAGIQLLCHLTRIEEIGHACSVAAAIRCPLAGNHSVEKDLTPMDRAIYSIQCIIWKYNGPKRIPSRCHTRVDAYVLRGVHPRSTSGSSTSTSTPATDIAVVICTAATQHQAHTTQGRNILGHHIPPLTSRNITLGSTMWFSLRS